jgi:hypothetical protein
MLTVLLAAAAAAAAVHRAQVLSLHGNDSEATSMCRNTAVLKKSKGPKPVEVYIGHWWKVKDGKVVGLVVSGGAGAEAQGATPAGRCVYSWYWRRDGGTCADVGVVRVARSACDLYGARSSPLRLACTHASWAGP